MKLWFLKFIGSGAGYVILVLGGLLSLQTVRVADLKGDKAELERELNQALADKTGAQIAIVTQDAQAQRQEQNRKEQTNAEQYIRSVPDSQECASSAPLQRSLDWVRELDAAETDSDGH